MYCIKVRLQWQRPMWHSTVYSNAHLVCLKRYSNIGIQILNRLFPSGNCTEHRASFPIVYSLQPTACAIHASCPPQFTGSCFKSTLSCCCNTDFSSSVRESSSRNTLFSFCKRAFFSLNFNSAKL